jgi:hypothetical protein
VANVVQMTVDAFHRELDKLETAARAEAQGLEAQKLALQNAYSAARTSGSVATRRFLEPLIHRNSQLRLRYRDAVAKFNALVNGARSLLAKVGVKVPDELTQGLGVAPALLIAIPATLAILLAGAWAVIREVNSGRRAVDEALKSEGPRLLAIANDPTRTPEERAQALSAYTTIIKKANQGGFNFGDLTPILLAVGAIVLLPPILEMVNRRRAA